MEDIGRFQIHSGEAIVKIGGKTELRPIIIKIDTVTGKTWEFVGGITGWREIKN